jgi:DNA polymerase gamma 1
VPFFLEILMDTAQAIMDTQRATMDVEQAIVLSDFWVGLVSEHLELQVPEPPELWDIPANVWVSGTAKEPTMTIHELPRGLYVVDIETCNLSLDYWVPFCATIYDLANKRYWFWVAKTINNFVYLPIARGSTLIGHNITGYDRRYFENEYQVDPPFEYIDTMGLATRLRGVSNQQVPLYKLHHQGRYQPWAEEHYGSSLKGLCEAYLDLSVSKETRDVMVGKPWTWYQENKVSILSYCAKDVYYTVLLAQKLWAESVESFHPISLRAMGLLSKSRIPLQTGDLIPYIKRADEYYGSRKEKIAELLKQALDQVFERFVLPWSKGLILMGQIPESYHWLDWTPGKSGPTKGLPAWWRKKTKILTLDSQLTPIILGVRYDGQLVSYRKIGKTSAWFYGDELIPHPEGEPHLGAIFNKHHWALLGTVLTTEDPSNYEILELAKKLQFWKAFRGRVYEAFRFTSNGIHIPDYKPWGTISGRGSDALWLVSPSPKADVPGSELRSLARAPHGHKIVGADFASQEMRIFAFLGDSLAGRLGSSELSNLILNNGDIHTALAETSGAPRGLCKNINYGAVYGLGLVSAEKYCRLAGMEDPKAMARTILESLRGKKAPSGQYSGGIGSKCFNAIQALMKNYQGAESPILGNKITKALRTKDFVPSRQNWFVQASGSDLRDLLVVCLHALRPEVSLMLYIHDEPRYLVPEDLAQDFVADLQSAHYAAITHMMAIFGLPQPPDHCLRFDAVEIDDVWRKSATDPCVTPTQPVPIPPGLTVLK